MISLLFVEKPNYSFRFFSPKNKEENYTRTKYYLTFNLIHCFNRGVMIEKMSLLKSKLSNIQESFFIPLQRLNKELNVESHGRH